MKMHNHYNYGQLFCFSGLDGETSRNDDFVAMMMDEPVTLRFHFDDAVTLRLPLPYNAKFSAVLGDMLDGEDCFVAMVDRLTVVGKSTAKPMIYSEKNGEVVTDGDTQCLKNADGKRFYLTVRKEKDGYRFTFSYGVKVAALWTDEAMETLKAERYAYFENLPKCPDEQYEQLYYKCLSINKENIYSPEGQISCPWTTPDRVPHRFMWLWDSAFHAMSFLQYNVEMAKNCIRSVLVMEREDGFIPHMMCPEGAAAENIHTQPQVLAWATWEIYEKTKDKEFLRECVPALDKFLRWTMKNRDNNGNGLLEWYTDPDYKECKCGESGLDNCPRFDFDIEMDAIDFSVWLCHDAKHLAKIYEALGDTENADYFAGVYENVKNKINELLWSEEDGFYCDRLFSGELTRVVTPTSFLPMFAGICSQERADRMVKVLLDKERFWTKLPVPTIPRNSEIYDIDMWRGCSWLNINYFIMLGLRAYGYADVAEELRKRTLNSVQKWYKQTGNIFEFYDADDETCPFRLKRKGEQPEKIDYRTHVHAITDYNWSACFTLLMIGKVGL